MATNIQSHFVQLFILFPETAQSQRLPCGDLRARFIQKLRFGYWQKKKKVEEEEKQML